MWRMKQGLLRTQRTHCMHPRAQSTLNQTSPLVLVCIRCITRRKNCLLCYIVLHYIILVCLVHQLWHSEQPSWSLPTSAYFPTCLILFPPQPLLTIRASSGGSCAAWGQQWDYFYTFPLLTIFQEKWTGLINCTLLTDHITKPSFSDISCLLYCYRASNKKRYLLLFSIPFFTLLLTISLDGLRVIQGINRVVISHQAHLIPAILIKCSYFV